MNLTILDAIFSHSFWSLTILNNTLKSIFFAVISLPIFLIVFKIIQSLLIHRFEKFAKRTKTDIDDTFVKIIQSLRPGFYVFLSLYLSIRFLTLNGVVLKIVNVILIILVTYQAVLALQILINYILIKLIKQEEDKSTDAAIALAGKVIKYVLWLFGGLLILSNLGVNVTSLVAGLGIGGIAIALALQNILSDLFSSFAIYFDKPFQVGDFIIIDKHKGTVQHIGIKTTRIKSIDGEEIIIPNKKLTSAQVRNFKKMEERRVVVSFGVVYQTKTSQLRKIPRLIKTIIKNIKDAKIDRINFKAFGPSSLDFELVYFVETNKYKKYMGINEKVLLKIKEEFEKQGIEFAYPTQTVYLNS